jgi:hypothetical protein
VLAPAKKNIDILADSSFGRGSSWELCGRSLRFQEDGNLVIRSGNRLLWSSRTQGRGFSLRMQEDGNVVIYNSNGRPIWSTRTQGNVNAFLSFQTDGNLVVYSENNTPIFSTNTQNR